VGPYPQGSAPDAHEGTTTTLLTPYVPYVQPDHIATTGASWVHAALATTARRGRSPQMEGAPRARQLTCHALQDDTEAAQETLRSRAKDSVLLGTTVMRDPPHQLRTRATLAPRGRQGKARHNVQDHAMLGIIALEAE